MEFLRIILGLAGAIMVMFCIRVAYQRRHDSGVVLALASYLALLVVPFVLLLDFDRGLTWALAPYVIALVLGFAAAHAVYDVRSPRTRERQAVSRAAAFATILKIRRGQDKLRADDRLSQADERADSRVMFDAAPAQEDESVETAEYREGMRELADENREHSHELQDSERDTAREDQDKSL